MEYSQIIKWKRFSRSPYAVFCSLHKVINIGVLSVAIIANADAKSNNSHESEESPVYYEMLDDIEVTAGEEGISINGPDAFTYTIQQREIKTAPQPSVNDLLKQVPEVDVRQRGAFGVQTDISIKGATPEQTRVTLNGVNISSPQTGHLSADFPVSIGAVKQIELSEGKGENDAINIVTKPDTINKYEAIATAGLYGSFGVDNIINIHNKNCGHIIDGAFSRSDGATLNSDFRAGKFHYMGQTSRTKPILAEWQMGFSRKSFGANTFYSPAYDNQWERTNRILSSARIETNTPIKFATQLSWCRDYDHFQLVRNEHFGENYHRTDALTFSPELKKHWGKGISTFKINYRHEKILSTNLGVPMENDSIKIFGSEQYYTKRQKRETVELYLGHQHQVKRWIFDAGLRYTQAKDLDDRHAFSPFLKTTYSLRRAKICFSLNNALRIPSFTDLFYKSPVNMGNIGLKNEKKTTGQLTLKHHRKGFRNEGYVFHTVGREMIDWVMYFPEDTYHSANFGLRNTGFGYHGEIRLSDLSDLPIVIGLGYQHIWQKRKDDISVYKSLYALEYLRNKVTADVNIEPIRGLNIRFDTRLVERIGNYIQYENRTSTGILQPYKPYCITDMEVGYQTKWGRLFATINNLFNKTYVDFGNVTQAGFYGQLGISFHLGEQQ